MYIRGEDLFKSKYEKGTARFERYITVQCTDDGAHLNLGARPLYKEDGISGGLLQLMAECRAHGIRIKLLMLDREFFTVKCIRVLDELCLGYLTPCSNRPGVVAAIRQFADGKRQDVSESRLSGSDGTVSYTLVIRAQKAQEESKERSTAGGEIHRVCHQRARHRRRAVRPPLGSGDRIFQGVGHAAPQPQQRSAPLAFCTRWPYSTRG